MKDNWKGELNNLFPVGEIISLTYVQSSGSYLTVTKSLAIVFFYSSHIEECILNISFVI